MQDLMKSETRRGRASLVIAFVGSILASMGAQADLTDPEIYSLMGATGTSVSVCGTTDCVGDGTTVADADSRTASDSDGYAIFSIYEVGPAGSGYIDPFLRFQHNEGPANGNANIETAYNTDNDDLQRAQDPTPGGFDYINQAKDTVAGGKKDPGDFNHAILYDQLLVDDEGYVTFLLDINESNSEDKSTLRLDELSFFISTSPNLNNYNPELDASGAYDPLEWTSCSSTTTSGDGSTSTVGSAGCFDSAYNDGQTFKVWDMDLDSVIGSTLLDNVNDGSAGSGDYDLSVRVSAALFEAYAADLGDGQLYVYLENTAGMSNDMETFEGGEVSAGFEEWAVIGGDNRRSVPIPGSLLLTGLGLVLLAGRRVRK